MPVKEVSIEPETLLKNSIPEIPTKKAQSKILKEDISMQPELYLKKSLTSIPTNEITIEP